MRWNRATRAWNETRTYFIWSGSWVLILWPINTNKEMSITPLHSKLVKATLGGCCDQLWSGDIIGLALNERLGDRMGLKLPRKVFFGFSQVQQMLAIFGSGPSFLYFARDVNIWLDFLFIKKIYVGKINIPPPTRREKITWWYKHSVSHKRRANQWWCLLRSPLPFSRHYHHLPVRLLQIPTFIFLLHFLLHDAVSIQNQTTTTTTAISLFLSSQEPRLHAPFTAPLPSLPCL